MESYIVNLHAIPSSKGNLVALQNPESLSFAIKRIYYIYGVNSKGHRRGFHAHQKLEQVLICVSGSVKILVKTPEEEQVFLLDNPSKGLFVGKMIWREMFEFTKNAILIVLASEKYDEHDYFRSYDQYVASFNKEKKI